MEGGGEGGKVSKMALNSQGEEALPLVEGGTWGTEKRRRRSRPSLRRKKRGVTKTSFWQI